MNRRALKYPVVAALFSAAFLFIGQEIADAYTYNGNNITVDKVTEDENDLTVTNKSSIGSNSNIVPQKIKTQYVLTNKSATMNMFYYRSSTASQRYYTTEIRHIPGNLSKEMYNDFISMLKKCQDQDYYLKDFTYNNTSYRKYFFSAMEEFNNKYGTLIFVDGRNDIQRMITYFLKNVSYNDSNHSLSYPDQGWLRVISDSDTNTETYKDYAYVTNKEDASITVSTNSTLSSKGNVQTSKAISVTGNSQLTTATGTVTGGTITSDGDIIAQSNYSAPSGKSTISGATITSSGALTASKDIKATTGAISGTVIQATGGNVVANNSIKATGKVKGNALNVSVINASSASITGNQSINGIFTTTGQAKLNGGATLGSKKITGLGAGTLSGTSTEAVNGSQLYTIKQGVAAKTYKAGADIIIGSDNTLSVAKKGTVKSGDTGIVTGGTVYTETNSLNTKLSGLKELVNSHQTTISSLQQQMGDLNQTISDINSNVASATSNLANQLKNCLKSDMGNLSAAGRTAIKTIISDSLKSMGRQSSQSLTSPIATFEAPSASDTVTTKDVDSVHNSLKDKLDKSTLSTISANVDSNTKQIGVNADNIHTNTSSIESLKSGKADVSGSNIDSSAYAKKLGTGSVAKGDTGLVSGDTVYGALAGKADISYVDSGIGMMENQMAGIRQQATHDINRVGAGASALASLHPSAYDASDKISFATGYGHYKNANTSALGTFYHPNEKTMVSVAGTIGNNDAMLSAGISIKLGMSDHVSKVMVTPKMFSAQQVTNENMKDHIDTQSERLHQIEMALQNR